MRVRVEHVLRGIVFAALAAMFWQSLHEQTDSGRQAVTARALDVGTLTRWSSLAIAPGRIHVQLDSVPTKIDRAWLGGLAGAGSIVTWSGDPAPAMIDAQPVASPMRGTRVLVAAPSGSSVVMSDDVGVIDSVRAERTGFALTLNSVARSLSAYVKGSVASTATRDSVALRRILVIGEAAWETKFVVAALEEDGWKLDAFIRVAPGVDVTQGSTAGVDTSRYSAIVALDGAAAPYASRIVEFARTGGGVVLSPQAASLDAMASLRSGNAGRATSEARATQVGGSVTLATLPVAPITSLRSDAVVLEKQAGAVAIAARRIGAGRALQLGYEETWRWRMGGGNEAVRDHRLWWTGLVSSVAYAPRVSRTAIATATDEGPMVGLVSAIGARMPEAAVSSLSGNRSNSMTWVFVLLALGLVGEIASRRLRGAS
jgi:hypothetical protein